MRRVAVGYDGVPPERPSVQVPGWGGDGGDGWQPWQSASVAEAGTMGCDLVWRAGAAEFGTAGGVPPPFRELPGGQYYALDTGTVLQAPRGYGLLVLPHPAHQADQSAPLAVMEFVRWWWPKPLTVTFRRTAAQRFAPGLPYAKVICVPHADTMPAPMGAEARGRREAAGRFLARNGDRYVTRRGEGSDNLYARLAHFDDQGGLPAGLTGEDDTVPNQGKAGPPRLLAAPPRRDRPRPRGPAPQEDTPPAPGAAGVRPDGPPDPDDQAAAAGEVR